MRPRHRSIGIYVVLHARGGNWAEYGHPGAGHVGGHLRIQPTTVSDSQLLSDFKAEKHLSTCTPQSVLELLKNGKMKVG